MIELINVSKKIGKNEVLKNFSYKFEEGKCYLIKGHNGSGKTMLLRTICSLLTPDEGKIETTKDYNYGVVIENPSFFNNDTAFYNLKYLADIRKVISDKEIDEALDLVGLLEKKDIKVKKFSLGMRQKLGLAQAIMEDQEVLLLDEPFNALDSNSLKNITELLISEKSKGKIILVVAHNYYDKYNIFDEILEMNSGELINSIQQ